MNRIFDTSGIPQTILGACETFFDCNPFARAWARYPDVSAELDETMPACEGMSVAFYHHLEPDRFDAVEVIEASEAVEADADYHLWVRVRSGDLWVNVDWTARQFHNLEWDDALQDWNPAFADLPCPMLWLGDGPAHPVVDFTQQRTVTIAPRAAVEMPQASVSNDLGF